MYYIIFYLYYTMKIFKKSFLFFHLNDISRIKRDSEPAGAPSGRGFQIQRFKRTWIRWPSQPAILCAPNYDMVLSFVIRIIQRCVSGCSNRSRFGDIQVVRIGFEGVRFGAGMRSQSASCSQSTSTAPSFRHGTNGVRFGFSVAWRQLS